MAAAAPFVPMIIGAGVGAITDKGNPLRGAILGGAGGGLMGPASTALMGMGTAAPAAASMAAMPSAAASGAMSGGLPSMASIAATMPGGMSMPGLMAGGSTFGANAAGLATAYNALPMAERFGALTNQGLGGLFKTPGPKAKSMANIASSLMQSQQQQGPRFMPYQPPQMAMQPQNMRRFRTSSL